MPWRSVMGLSSSGFMGSPGLESLNLRLRTGRQKTPELLWVVGLAQSVIFGDQASEKQFADGFFHGAHPMVGSGLNGGVNLMRLRLSNDGRNARGNDQHLARSDPSLAVEFGQEHLGD